MASVILGIDPGLAALGFGVIRCEADEAPVHLGHGVFRTEKRAGLTIARDLSLRIGELALGLQTILDKHHPDHAAIEEFRFYGKNVSSCLQVANVIGMVREACRSRGIPVTEYSAQDIKRSVTGYSNADKGQVQKMVRHHLSMLEVPKPDHAADGLAAALTHAARMSRRAAVQAALGGKP